MPEQIKKFDYDSFDFTTFESERASMEAFRQNSYEESMEEKWKALRNAYSPTEVANGSVLLQYVTDSTTGLATPDRIVGSSEDDEIYKFVEPLVAIKVHTALSLLTQRTPDVKWDSDLDKYEKNVPVINALRASDWYDPQTRSQYVMLWFYNIVYGTTYWRRFYDKCERDVFMPQKIDFATKKVEFDKVTVTDFDATTGEALSPFDVWIDPSTQPMMPRSMRKVMWRKVYEYEKFIDKCKQYQTEEWLRENVKPTAVDGAPGPGNVEVRFYEHMDLDLFYISAQQKEIYKTHMPQNHKQLSVLMSIWMPRANGPFGLGPIEMMMEDKRALDEFKSMTLTQVKFAIYKAVFYTGSLQSEGESGGIKIRPDRAYKVSDKPTFLDIPGPGKDAWDAQMMLRERIDDASGINRPLGGEIVKTTAFQTDLAKDAALARLAVPISGMVLLLQRDAMLTYELQKQYYALPKVKELVDDDELAKAAAELEIMRQRGEEPSFDVFVDQSIVDADGHITPKYYRGDYRKLQLNVEKSPSGSYTPSMTKSSVTLVPELLDWQGKAHVIADSILTITPTLEKTKVMEMYNILIPMFGQPPQLVAKPAKAICKLYGQDPEDVLPEPFLQYLEQIETGEAQQPQGAPGVTPEVPMGPGSEVPGGAPAAPQQVPGQPLTFQQKAAPSVVTNINGQKDMISAASEALH